MFVMEREETARARGARIYAEVAGYGSTCDAYHRVRMDDSGEEPARAMSLAMKDAAIDPSDVDYLNYHGTSTDLNDRIETRAVKLAFGKHATRLAGSATKSMIGHPQGACGAAGVAATLMAFRDRSSPPRSISTTRSGVRSRLRPRTGPARDSTSPSATRSRSARRTRRWC